jgi:class 3 adenylate cyclase
MCSSERCETDRMAELPTGTLSFVFSDVEGSTRLLRQLREGYHAVLAEHQQLLRDAFGKHGGHEVDTQGDSFFVAFSRPRDAVLAAVAAQRSIEGHRWPPGVELRVRIGIHTGPAELVGDRYVGLAVHRAARICAAGNGGQVLLSQATWALLADDEDELPGLELRDLGEQRLKDFDRAVRVYQVVAPGIEDEKPLRTEEPPEPEAVWPDLTPAIRASDAERERAVRSLREHAAAGRLTLEELSERAEPAYAAVTLADLEEIGRDLPAAPLAFGRPRRRPKRFTGVIFSDTERTGRWRLPRFSLTFVLFGNADLDLRQAELDGPTASFTALVLFGNVDLYVPEGVEVDLGGLAVIGHRREWGRDVPPLPGTPLLRVHIFSLFGTADVWRVPVSWAGRTFREVIRSLQRGEQRELPSGG